MAEQCYSCAYGLTRSPPAVAPIHATQSDLLGACWECGVLACSEHAERDRKSAKWKCFPGIANALLSSSSQSQSAPPSTDQSPTAAMRRDSSDAPFTDSDDFIRRFPGLANASAERRLEWRSSKRAALRQAHDRVVERLGGDVAGAVNMDLLADALGVATFLTVGPMNNRAELVEQPQSWRQMVELVLTDDLSVLLVDFLDV